ncbi:DUF4166 domain-containing protein [Brevibacterium sp. CSND-B09]|uniref:DUF4166 domain-containing protein n=1 Tax=Brevibacterium sp. CSND-B09 TaxID=3462571 RepID=UPI00406A40D0
MSSPSRSAYERALGARVAELHPVLRRYFAVIPPGAVGVGEGVFESFGTQRRWLWPVLAIAKRCGVIVPGLHREVPFRVENRTDDGEQTATRTMKFDDGDWSMVDAVSFVPRGSRSEVGGEVPCDSQGGVVDLLGKPPVVEAEFAVDVVNGGLRLRSRRIALRAGGLRLPMPLVLRPVIELSERFDDTLDRQRVELYVDLPLIGRVYEYSGTFTYRIVSEYLRSTRVN